MMLLDSSVIIPVTRGKSPEPLKALVAAIGGDDFYLSRFTELELLQGAQNAEDWSRLVVFFDAQELLGLRNNTWREAAAIYFELRRMGSRSEVLSTAALRRRRWNVALRSYTMIATSKRLRRRDH